MVHVTSGQVTLGKAASLLGIVQGIAWFAMSLICIIEYNIEKPPEIDTSSSLAIFNSRVYYFYLNKNADLPTGTIVTPTTFTVFMCVYIIIITMWVVASLFQISIVGNRGVNVPIVFKDWALITFMVSLVDFILVVLLGVDYGKYCLPNYAEDLCINTVIPVLVIAARGFALWFVNVVIAWIMLRNAEDLRKGGSYEGTFGGIIPIYRATGHIPRATVSQEPSLYSQQARNVQVEKNLWNVNLRTAMVSRTPPVTPTSSQYGSKSPYPKNQQFFESDRSSPVSPNGRNRQFFAHY